MMSLLLFLRCVKKGTDDDRGKYLKLMLKEKAIIENYGVASAVKKFKIKNLNSIRD